jgi:hypothetical protein
VNVFAHSSLTSRYHTMWKTPRHILKGCIALLLAGTFLSCADYDYSSPLPGILEVRLRVKNERTSVIPFSNFNVFNIIVKDFIAQRDDGAFLVILPDLNAIRRKKNGDTLNCLSFAARDSQIILGKTYAPPGVYPTLVSERSTAVTHDPGLARFDGVSYQFIPVLDNAPPSRFTMMRPHPPIEVKEGKTTVVVLTLDLDVSLVRRSEWFDWVAPMVFVSSIQQY